MLRKIFTKSKRIINPVSLLYGGIFIIALIIAITNSRASTPTAIKKTTSSVFNSTSDLKAKSVYVFDSKENKVLFAKNEHTPLPLASITKLMTAYCTLQNINMDTVVTVPDSVYSYNDNASSTGAYERWWLKNLVEYTLIESSNSGALELAGLLGGEKAATDCMNREALKMNLFETKFLNTTGLDVDAFSAGAYGSAENVTTMLTLVYSKYPDVVGKTSNSEYEIYSLNGKLHRAHNTNSMGKNTVGILASKTGLTELAGGNLVYVMNVGLDHKVYVAILGSTEEGRFEDALLLNRAVIESL